MVKQQPATPAPRPAGFVDLLPGTARRRRSLEDSMLRTFEDWGYELVATPSVELLDNVELGVQAEQSRRLFKFGDADGRVLALVGERTVSIARVVAGQLQQSPRPLRLCYLGPTFQGHPAPGGRRESFQAGAELLGTHSAAADAEVVALAIRALEACGLEEFQVELGHVGFFGGLVRGLPESERLLVSDALVGRDLVELEQALAGTSLGEAEQALLLRFPALRGGLEILEAAGALVDNAMSAEALAELRDVFALLQAHGVAARVNLDLGAVRDFDYYTGTIFEVFTAGHGAPVAAGGRYDNLLQKFGAPLPATGVVVFLDGVHQVLGGRAAAPAHRRLALVGFESDPAAAITVSASLRQGGRRVVTEDAPMEERELRRRARTLGADETVFCDAAGAWVLDGAGRTPLGSEEQGR